MDYLNCWSIPIRIDLKGQTIKDVMDETAKVKDFIMRQYKEHASDKQPNDTIAPIRLLKCDMITRSDEYE